MKVVSKQSQSRKKKYAYPQFVWRPSPYHNNKIRGLAKAASKPISFFLDQAGDLLLLRYSSSPVVVRLGDGRIEVISKNNEQS